VGVVACTGLVEALRTTGLRHGDIPPVAACAGSWDRVSFDHDDRGHVAAAGVDNHRLEVVNVGSLLGMRAQHAGATDEQIKEAIAVSGLVRKMSTELNGNQYDLAAFKKQIDAAFASMKTE
jgi:hypothetical protein